MDRQSVTEELRLHGNDAFGTKDWDSAKDLYQQSVEAFPTAKAYSYLAATWCKLSDYPQAAVAAEQATALDPKWAKGWWRRGATAELRKCFPEALNFYGLACQLEPKDQSFRKSLRAMEQRLNVQGKEDGFYVVDPSQSQGQNAREETPSMKAFWKARRTVGLNQPVRELLEQYGQREVEAAKANNRTLVPTRNNGWFMG